MNSFWFKADISDVIAGFKWMKNTHYDENDACLQQVAISDLLYLHLGYQRVV